MPTTRSRRTPVSDDVFQVDPEAERKRLLGQQREDAIAAARQSLDDVAAPDSDQSQRALQILSTMEREADEAIVEGADAETITSQLDESLTDWHSYIDGAEDEDGVVNSDAVDEAIDKLEESARELEEVAFVQQIEQLDSDSDSEDEALQQLADLVSDSDSGSDEEQDAFELGLSPVAAAADDSSEDEWSTGGSPTPIEQRRSDLATTLAANVQAPREQETRDEEAEAQAVGEAKALRQREAAAASKARRAALSSEDRAIQKEARDKKMKAATALARKEQMQRRFRETNEDIVAQSSSQAIVPPSASTIIAVQPTAEEVQQEFPEPDEPPPGFVQPAPVVDTGSMVSDPSIDLDQDEQASIRELNEILQDSDDEAAYAPLPVDTTDDALDQIDALIAEAQVAVENGDVNIDTVSVAELSAIIEKEVDRQEDMSSIKDRLTDPAQAAAFANATRQTPRLLKLIAQGVYAPTAFTGTAGKQAAAKIEQQLAYSEAASKRTGTRRAANPIVTRERPVHGNPNIKRWRRPRFTTSTIG